MSAKNIRKISPHDSWIIDDNGIVIGIAPVGESIATGGSNGGFVQASTDLTGGISTSPNLLGIAGGTIGQARRVALVGDSMSFAQNTLKTITAASRTSGVVTITATTHNVPNGGYIAVTNMSPSSFNATKVIATVVDANTITYVSPGADGSASNLGASKAMVLADYSSRTDRGIGTWLCDLTAGSVEGWINGGANGQDATDMLARVPEILTNCAIVDDVIILAGYNDFAIEHRTADAVFADVLSIISFVRATGKRAVVISALPWITGGTTTDRGEAARYNRLIAQWCLATNAAIFVDAARKLIDAASATAFAAQAGLLNTDGIHPCASGVRLIAQEIVSTVYPSVPTVSRLATNAADCYGYNTSSKNIWDYGPFGSGAAGTASTGVTGPVATGFTATCSASATATASVVQKADGTGYVQRLVLTSTGAAQWVRLTPTSTISTARFNAGDSVVMTGRITLTGVSGSNLYGINASIGSNTIVNAFAVTASNTDSAKYPQIDRTVTFVSAPVIVPAGTTALNFSIYVLCSAAGTAVTADIDGIAFIKQ